ncbi:hypothetical protein [Marinicellulosiphila megalodicopiae]|uniref:hypothetical protein n=1 Tax=Marinicellulosiphila megalodicopiae TaxID=2724896 RepID=UPI003BB14A38
MLFDFMKSSKITIGKVKSTNFKIDIDDFKSEYQSVTNFFFDTKKVSKKKKSVLSKDWIYILNKSDSWVHLLMGLDYFEKFSDAITLDASNIMCVEVQNKDSSLSHSLAVATKNRLILCDFSLINDGLFRRGDENKQIIKYQNKLPKYVISFYETFKSIAILSSDETYINPLDSLTEFSCSDDVFNEFTHNCNMYELIYLKGSNDRVLVGIKNSTPIMLFIPNNDYNKFQEIKKGEKYLDRYLNQVCRDECPKINEHECFDLSPLEIPYVPYYNKINKFKDKCYEDIIKIFNSIINSENIINKNSQSNSFQLHKIDSTYNLRYENGVGDTINYFINPDFQLIVGFDHESILSPFAREKYEVYPNMYSGVPSPIFDVLKRSSVDETLVTFAYWKSKKDEGYRHGAIDIETNAENGIWLIDYLFTISNQYIDYAKTFYGKDTVNNIIKDEIRGAW